MGRVLIGIGLVATLAGLGLLMWCIYRVVSAQRKELAEDEMRSLLGRMVPLNLAALGVSGLGLMILIMGFVLD